MLLKVDCGGVTSIGQTFHLHDQHKNDIIIPFASLKTVDVAIDSLYITGRRISVQDLLLKVDCGGVASVARHSVCTEY